MMEEQKGFERRRVARISANFPVTLQLNGKQYSVRAKEFSEFGILLATSRKDLLGESVEVALQLNPEQPSVPMKGVVVYCTEAGMAVRFKDISSEQRALFNSYIESQDLGKSD